MVRLQRSPSVLIIADASTLNLGADVEEVVAEEEDLVVVEGVTAAEDEDEDGVRLQLGMCQDAQ